MEKCNLYLDFFVDLCYNTTIENYRRMKNAEVLVHVRLQLTEFVLIRKNGGVVL